jgi:outer membrane protein
MRRAALAALLAAVPSLAIAQQSGRPAQPRSTVPIAPPAPVAPDTAAFNVAVVDIVSILRRSTAAQALQRQMQTEQEKYQLSADQQQRSLQAEEEGIERQRSSLSTEAYSEKRRGLQEKVNLTTAEFRARRRQIDEAFNNANGEISRTLLQVIEELARARAIELVVRREAVVYLQDGEDLTQLSLETLNQRLPEVTVSLPAEIK